MSLPVLSLALSGATASAVAHVTTDRVLHVRRPGRSGRPDSHALGPVTTLGAAADALLFFSLYGGLRTATLRAGCGQTPWTSLRAVALEEVLVGTAAGAAASATCRFGRHLQRRLVEVLLAGLAPSLVRPAAKTRPRSASQSSLSSSSSSSSPSSPSPSDPWSLSSDLLLALDPGLTFALQAVLSRLARERWQPRLEQYFVTQPPSQATYIAVDAAVTLVVSALSKAAAATLLYPLHTAARRTDVSEPATTTTATPSTHVLAKALRILRLDGLGALYADLPRAVAAAALSHGLTMATQRVLYSYVLRLLYAVADGLAQLERRRSRRAQRQQQQTPKEAEHEPRWPQDEGQYQLRDEVPHETASSFPDEPALDRMEMSGYPSGSSSETSSRDLPYQYPPEPSSLPEPPRQETSYAQESTPEPPTQLHAPERQLLTDSLSTPPQDPAHSAPLDGPAHWDAPAHLDGPRDAPQLDSADPPQASMQFHAPAHHHHDLYEPANEPVYAPRLMPVRTHEPAPYYEPAQFHAGSAQFHAPAPSAHFPEPTSTSTTQHLPPSVQMKEPPRLPPSSPRLPEPTEPTRLPEPPRYHPVPAPMQEKPIRPDAILLSDLPLREPYRGGRRLMDSPGHGHDGHDHGHDHDHYHNHDREYEHDTSAAYDPAHSASSVSIPTDPSQVMDRLGSFYRYHAQAEPEGSIIVNMVSRSQRVLRI